MNCPRKRGNSNESNFSYSLSAILGLIIMTAVLVLTIVIITLLIKRTPEPTQLVRVVPDGPTTTLTAFQSTDDCRNSDVLSPKGTGCTEDAAKADFMSKAKTKCDTECAKNTWDEKDCVHFGYVADVQCRSVIGTDCEGGTGFECRVPGAVLVECVCKCDSST